MEKNERAINSSADFMSEFLSESVRQYHLVKYMNESPQKEFSKDLKVNLTSLLDGMMQDIPEDSPKRKQTLAAAKIIKKDLGKYIKGMDKALVEGRDRELNDPKTAAELRNEYDSDAPYMASLKAAEDTVIVKSIKDLKEVGKKEKAEKEPGSSYFKKASEFLQSIGCEGMAKYFDKMHTKHEIKQERKADIAQVASIQSALIKSLNKGRSEGKVNESNSSLPKVIKTGKIRGGRG